MSPLGDIPEIQGLDSRQGLLRIPPELDVPLTPRVRRLIDAAPFRRLARISQLGLVSLVYPAANHSRFEHSLGVYRMGLLYLRRLSYDARFTAAVSPHDAETLIAAALLHDIGHWPFCQQAYPLIIRPHGRPAVALMVDSIEQAQRTLAERGFTMITEHDLMEIE